MEEEQQMSDVIKNTVKNMTAEQLDFIMSEFGVTKDEIYSWSEDKWDEVYDALCDIELDELTPDGEESPRCKMATDLVTMIGNEIATDQGIYDEDEFENDLKD